MKWLSTALVCAGFLFSTLPADAQHVRLYRAVIHTTQRERIDGILYDVTDSAVQYVANTRESIQLLRAGTPDVQAVSVSGINRIVVRRKGHVGKGVLTGVAVGLLFSLPVAFNHPASATDLEVLARSVAGIGLVTSGAICGTLTSIVPNKVIRHVNQPNPPATTHQRLHYYAYRTQQRDP